MTHRRPSSRAAKTRAPSFSGRRPFGRTQWASALPSAFTAARPGAPTRTHVRAHSRAARGGPRAAGAALGEWKQMRGVRFSLSFLLDVSARQPLEELSSSTPLPHPPPRRPDRPQPLHYSLCFPRFARAGGCERAQGLQRPERRSDPARAGRILALRKTSGGEGTVFRPLLLLDERCYRGRFPGPRFIAAC